jgi:hypothetical protein
MQVRVRKMVVLAVQEERETERVLKLTNVTHIS